MSVDALAESAFMVFIYRNMTELFQFGMLAILWMAWKAFLAEWDAARTDA